MMDAPATRVGCRQHRVLTDKTENSFALMFGKAIRVSLQLFLVQLSRSQCELSCDVWFIADKSKYPISKVVVKNYLTAFFFNTEFLTIIEKTNNLVCVCGGGGGGGGAYNLITKGKLSELQSVCETAVTSPGHNSSVFERKHV